MKKVTSKDVKTGRYYLIYKRISKDKPAHGKLISIVRRCSDRTWKSIGTLRTFGRRNGTYYYSMSIANINRLEANSIELIETNRDLYWDDSFCYMVKDIFELDAYEILINGNNVI